MRNKDKLVQFLETFQTEKVRPYVVFEWHCHDPLHTCPSQQEAQFIEEKNLIIDTLKALEVPPEEPEAPPAAVNATAAPQGGAAAAEDRDPPATT